MHTYDVLGALYNYDRLFTFQMSSSHSSFSESSSTPSHSSSVVAWTTRLRELAFLCPESLVLDGICSCLCQGRVRHPLRVCAMQRARGPPRRRRLPAVRVIVPGPEVRLVSGAGGVHPQEPVHGKSIERATMTTVKAGVDRSTPPLLGLGYGNGGVG